LRTWSFEKRILLGSDLNWRIKAGCIYGVIGGRQSQRSRLLRSVAGLEGSSAERTGFSDLRNSKGGSRAAGVTGAAYLPPPGEEIFVGTTVGEELEFYSKMGGRGRDELLRILEQIALFDFIPLWLRSVWELSAGERRMLLLAAQALAEPVVWVCDEPFELFDGKNAAKVCNLLRQDARNGAAVIVGSEEHGSILEFADYVLFLAQEEEPFYYGKVRDLPVKIAEALGWNPRLREAAAKARQQADPDALLKLILLERS